MTMVLFTGHAAKRITRGVFAGSIAKRVALAFAIPLFLVSCSDGQALDPRTGIPLVRVAAVRVTDTGARSFTGTVEARVRSDLGFQVSGKIVTRLVDAGQTVKRGQLLMRIDPIDLKLAAAAQEQAVVAARARAEQAANDEQRYEELRDTGAVSVSAYDQIKSAAAAARAQLSAAEAQAHVARNANAYSELVADRDGVVTETLAEPGQVVSAGQAVVRLAHAGRREAVIQLPETFRPALGSAAEATLFGGAGRTAPASLRQLADAADPLTRTYEARYVLEGELANAPLGATVTLRMSDGSVNDRPHLQVPIGALVDRGNGTGLWIISGEPARVAWKPISVESLDDRSATFTGEVTPGERVVALGAHLLREGDEVRIADGSATVAVTDARP